MGIEAGGLRRSLGLRTVVSTSAGLTFASSTFLVVVQVAYYLVGDAAWIPILIAGALCALAAAAFSELNGMYPTAAGIRLYIHRAFGEEPALIIALTYMTVVTVVVGTEAYVLSHVLSDVMPAIPPPGWIFLMLTIASVANLRGIKVAGAFQDVITYSVIASIVTMSVLALGRVHFQIPSPIHTGGFMPVFNAVGFAIFLFVGFEWVTPLAEEVREPRSIPVGMFIALALLAAVYSLIAVAMFASTGREILFGSELQRQAIPHVLWAARALGPSGRLCMVVTSLFMSLTTFNAGLMSVSRFIYSMAREHVLPKGLGQVSVRFRTPGAAVLVVYLIAIVVSFIVYFTERYVLLVNLAAATESFIYAIAGASVMALRRKEGQTLRPFRMAGGLGLPGVTSIIFLAIGIGVFFARPQSDYWGAALLLLFFALGWGSYVRCIVRPRKERVRAEQAARRTTRRTPRSATITAATDRPASDAGEGLLE